MTEARQPLLRLRETYGASVLVSLVGDAELELLGIPDLDWVARSRGVRVCQLPVVDGGVPENGSDVVGLVRVALRQEDACPRDRAARPVPESVVESKKLAGDGAIGVHRHA